MVNIVGTTFYNNNDFYMKIVYIFLLSIVLHLVKWNSFIPYWFIISVFLSIKALLMNTLVSTSSPPEKTATQKKDKPCKASTAADHTSLPTAGGWTTLGQDVIPT